MLPVAEFERRVVFHVDAPAGEGARRFLDVAFAVVTFAEREQLHHFTREIFVWLALAVGRGVEINNHRRVFGGGMQQVAEIAQGMLTQQHVLAVHQLRRAHFLHARYKVVVPEQGHALGQRRRCLQNLGHPPGFEFEVAQRLALLKGAALFFAQGAQTRRAFHHVIDPRGRSNAQWCRSG